MVNIIASPFRLVTGPRYDSMKHRVTSWILARWPRGGGKSIGVDGGFPCDGFLGGFTTKIWNLNDFIVGTSIAKFWAITKSCRKNPTQHEAIGTSSAFESWSKLFRTRSEAFKSWRTCSATNSTCPTGSFPGNEGILLCRCSSATWVVYITPSFTQNWFDISAKKIGI